MNRDSIQKSLAYLRGKRATAAYSPSKVEVTPKGIPAGTDGVGTNPAQPDAAEPCDNYMAPPEDPNGPCTNCGYGPSDHQGMPIGGIGGMALPSEDASKWTAEQRRQAVKDGAARPDGSFPIYNSVLRLLG